MTHHLLNINPVRPETGFTEALKAISEEKWAVLANACEDRARVLPDEAGMGETAKKVFVFSEFVAKRCARNPEMFLDLIETRDLLRSYDITEYQSKVEEKCRTADDSDVLAIMVRRLRTREMVRIAFRDLAGWASLQTTMKEITALADACLEGALSRLYQWMIDEYGIPVGENGKQQRLAVIGVGKLGGRELNFSSDVDLMFVFPEAGKTQGRENTISNEEFFARLCHRLIDIIGKNMTEGFVFRVDTRLRPYGESGPVAMSFEAMESYYQEQGRDWERYALIKARIVAGDQSAGRELLDRLRPFVYRRYLDYGMFESLREMKRKIEREVTRQGMQENIKLGPGGIREVEFFGQIFQLIRGGVNIDYQKRGILVVLQTLVNDNNIPEFVKNELTDAYVFLRYTENRLQMFDDRQTYSLPEDVTNRCRLALSMGFKDWREFSESLAAHMGKVHGHFQALLAREDSEPLIDEQSKRINDVWNNLPNVDTNLELLKEIGFDPAEDALEVLQNFLEIVKSCEVSRQGRQRINLLVPRIIKASVSSENPGQVLKRICELIKAIRSRSCYVSLLIENAEALTHLVRLAEASPWIISFLSRHPILLDELLDPRTLYAPLEKEGLKQEIKMRFNRLPDADLESQMDDLRIFKQINTLRICAADVAGLLPLMKVSDRLTCLAESLLEWILEMAWDHMVEKYGSPSGISDSAHKGFGIIAYGKLGGFELGYGSDLDLVFLHTGEKGYTRGGLLQPVDNAQFYVRLGQRIIHFLSTMTRTGKLYETDMRLRPSGSAGILVTHINGFEDYQKSRAWTWEHQALIKARAITGDVDVRERFEKIRTAVLSMKREKAGLRDAIFDMRARMREQRNVSSGAHFDLKNDPGGIVDIEFLVQFLVLLYAGRHPFLIQWTDVVRQLNSLAMVDVFDDKTAYILKQAYLVFRFYHHRLTLQERPAVLANDQFVDIRDQVKRLWKQYLVK